MKRKYTYELHYSVRQENWHTAVSIEVQCSDCKAVLCHILTGPGRSGKERLPQSCPYCRKLRKMADRGAAKEGSAPFIASAC